MSTSKDTFVSYVGRLVCDAKRTYAMKVWAALGAGKKAPRLNKPWAAKVVAKVTELHNAEAGITTPTSKAKQTRQAEAKAVMPAEVRTAANAAWKAAFDAAEDGQKKAAGNAASFDFILQCVELANADS